MIKIYLAGLTAYLALGFIVGKTLVDNSVDDRFMFMGIYLIGLGAIGVYGILMKEEK